jgi:hypothetical protein
MAGAAAARRHSDVPDLKRALELVQKVATDIDHDVKKARRRAAHAPAAHARPPAGSLAPRVHSGSSA